MVLDSGGEREVNNERSRRYGVDFRELIYITTVADAMSVTAAAKKFYISQPSLRRATWAL